MSGCAFLPVAVSVLFGPLESYYRIGQKDSARVLGETPPDMSIASRLWVCVSVLCVFRFYLLCLQQHGGLQLMC